MIVRQLRIFILFLLMVPFMASADPITYEYVGPNLPLQPDLPAGVVEIEGTFTVDLPPSNLDPLAIFPLLDYEFSDGLSIFSPDSGDYAVTASLFLTAADSEITSFLLQIFWDPFNTPAHPWPVGVAGYMEIRYNWFGDDLNIVSYCTVEGPDGTCFGTVDTASLGRGSLTVASVPEPGTLVLFGLGLAGLGLARRRRSV